VVLFNTGGELLPVPLEQVMNPNGLTDAEQTAYSAEYAAYQYDGESRLTHAELDAAALLPEWVPLCSNWHNGILTAGEFDKKVRDLLESS